MSEVRVSPTTDAAEQFRAWLASPERTITPRRVDVHRDVDSAGDSAWYYIITLDDPPAGKGTWDAEGLDEYLRLARDEAIDLGLDWPWYLQFRPETEDEPEEPALTTSA